MVRRTLSHGERLSIIKAAAQLELPLRESLVLAMMILEWRATGNPYFIDMAVLTCRNKAVPPPHLLLQAMFEVAEARLEGRIIGGTPEKARKTVTRWHMLMCMDDMCQRTEITMERAASKTAQLFSEIAPDFVCKASTLQKLYGDLMATALAKEVRAATATFGPTLSPEELAAYRAEVESLPEAKGKKRIRFLPLLCACPMHRGNVTNQLQMVTSMSLQTLITDEAAKYVRLSKPTLERLRLTGEGPRYCKLGGAVRYRTVDLDEWLESRLIRSTSEGGR
mgnify:CR=1 FL=1